MEEPGWYLGNFGESCTKLCSGKGLTCDAKTMTDIDDDAKLTKAALDAGVTCEELLDDPKPITPFYLANYNGRKNICEHLRNNAKSSCDASSKIHQRFCFCQ